MSPTEGPVSNRFDEDQRSKMSRARECTCKWLVGRRNNVFNSTISKAKRSRSARVSQQANNLESVGFKFACLTELFGWLWQTCIHRISGVTHENLRQRTSLYRHKLLQRDHTVIFFRKKNIWKLNHLGFIDFGNCVMCSTRQERQSTWWSTHLQRWVAYLASVPPYVSCFGLRPSRSAPRELHFVARTKRNDNEQITPGWITASIFDLWLVSFENFWLDPDGFSMFWPNQKICVNLGVLLF